MERNVLGYFLFNTFLHSRTANRLYAQLTSAFCKTDCITSGSGLLYVLHEFFFAVLLKIS